MLLEVTKNQADSTLVERRRNGSFAASEVALASPLIKDIVSEDEEDGMRKQQVLEEKEKLRTTQSAEETATATATTTASTTTNTDNEYKPELVWTNIGLFVILHSCLPVGLYMLFTQWPLRTLLWSILGMYASGLGVTGGSHRLWSHRAYKAKWPVQVILVCLQTMAGQNSIYTWSRDHRVHHKFAETDADPHNIKRGFFFAHMGWLCCKKHPEVKEKGKLIDMSDLESNPYVMFQHRHFWWMSLVFTVLVPTLIPVLLWQERFWTSFVFSFMVRYLITLHGTWLVNSAAHYYGERPYDKRIEARESPYVIFNGLGEGFHNYHHTFPYDYATSEFGRYMNITTTFIDLCASLGLVVDRRKVDPESILRRRARTGDTPPAELSKITERSEEDDDEDLSNNNNSNGQTKLLTNAAAAAAKQTGDEEEEEKKKEDEKEDENPVRAVGKSLANCGRLLVDNWRLSSGAAAVVQDQQSSSLISMIHA